MKYLFVIILLIISCLAEANAQKNNDSKFKDFGKISQEDFDSNIFENIGNYKYILLQNERKMYFDICEYSLCLFNSYRQHYKILQQNPFKNNCITIKYSGKNRYERCIQVKALVFRKIGQKITTIKIKNKQINYLNRDSLQSTVEIYFNDLKKDDIVDLQYIITSFDFLIPPSWKFNADVPCVASRFISETPYFMNYQFTTTGVEENVIHSNSDGFITLNYQFSPQDNPKSYYYMMGRTRRFLLNFRFRSDIDTFKLYNILPADSVCFPPVKNFGYPQVLIRALRISQEIGYSSPLYQAAWQQLTHLLYTYAEPENRYLSQSEVWFKMYNPGFLIFDSQSWQKLHKRLKKSPDFGKPLLKSFKLTDSLSTLLDDDYSDSLKKLIKIYDFVRFNIHWDSSYANTISRNIEEIIKYKYGNSAEINMTLVSLLRRAGFNAYPALASTRDNGLVDSSFANLIQFNTILSVVDFPELEKPLVMDASHIENSYNNLNKNDKNNMCWAVEPENYSMIDLISEDVDVDDIKLEISSVEGFSCKFKNYSTNDIAADKVAYCLNNKKSLIKKFYNLDIENVDIYSNLKFPDGNFECSGNFNITQQQASQPFKLFFNSNPFVDDIRTIPIDFICKKKISMEVITDKYSYIPENKVIKNQDNSLSASFTFEEKLGKLCLKFTLEINKSFFSTEEYFSLKEFFDAFFNQINVKI